MPVEPPSLVLRKGEDKDGTQNDVENGSHHTSAVTNIEKKGPSATTDAELPLLVHDSFIIPPTISLPLLVMVDMFAVSLVVPLIPQYFKSAGVTSAKQRELLSALYSSSQIVGGLAFGAIADAGILRRRDILLISFVGSAVAYGLIMKGGFWDLVISRLLVGSVKQTMTIASALMTQYSTKEERAKQLGRLGASSTAAWILGPSVGALMYKNINAGAPAALACGLFTLNAILAVIILPRDTPPSTASSGKRIQPKSDSKKSKLIVIWENLNACCSSPELSNAVLACLLVKWVSRATSYANLPNYYERMYNVESHHRGYISSYQQLLNFTVQSILVGPLMYFAGGERRAACFAAIMEAAATFVEMVAPFQTFLIVVSPAVMTSLALVFVSLNSLVTHVAPKESIGSVLAAIDVMQNVAAVTVPFYRTGLFTCMDYNTAGTQFSSIDGEPHPQVWLFCAWLHWIIAALVLSFLLFRAKHSPPKKAE